MLSGIVFQWTTQVKHSRGRKRSPSWSATLVSVVAVFTKFEALRPFAYGDIKKQLRGVSGEECSKRIAQRIEELFTNACFE